MFSVYRRWLLHPPHRCPTSLSSTSPPRSSTTRTSTTADAPFLTYVAPSPEPANVVTSAIGDDELERTATKRSARTCAIACSRDPVEYHHQARSPLRTPRRGKSSTAWASRRCSCVPAPMARLRTFRAPTSSVRSMSSTSTTSKSGQTCQLRSRLKYHWDPVPWVEDEACSRACNALQGRHPAPR